MINPALKTVQSSKFFLLVGREILFYYVLISINITLIKNRQNGKFIVN